MIDKGSRTPECCERIIVLSALRLTRTPVELHEELEKAANPSSNSHPYLSAIWSVLKSVGDQFSKKKGDSLAGSLIQGFNFANKGIKIQKDLLLKVPQVSQAIEHHLLNSSLIIATWSTP